MDNNKSKSTQRDFTNIAEKDCVRLIIAQDLKEFGIDVDANLGGGLGNLTTTSSQNHRNLANTSSNLNGTNSSHFHTNMHNHSLSVHATLGSNLKDFITSSTSKHHNKSNMSTNLISEHMIAMGSCDGQMSTRVFNLNMTSLELVATSVMDQTVNVPIFLKNSIEFLNEFLHIEGIFRRNGTASRLKELKKQVEEGIYNFDKFAIFDVTSILKQFFRELPESLLTFALYSNFIQAVKLETTKSKLESILNLCLQLPELNLNVLIYLMAFLKRVTLQESQSKMNSFNLAVCFAPNIIYTKVSKCNDLYINEERIVVQFLIENSGLIGKISDSVYERSLMLNSLCCSTTMMNNANNTTQLSGTQALSTTVDANTGNPQASISMNINPTCCKQNSTTIVNNDLLFLYENDLQENSSFAHHGQSAGSTSLSSYCGSSSSKKEKKKRRSSSLKELMNTIQNSISKFRRRSASEKNDKTTCSIITCSSMGNGISAISSTGAGDLSCTSRICYDEKQRFLMDSQTPYIGGHGKQMLTTPICSSLYATPRINKRNAEDSLQSTTKKKLMEKLPQRNLLLPNAPITPFSTTKKSKHPFKQLLSTSEASVSSKPNTTQHQPIINGSTKKQQPNNEDSTKIINLSTVTPHTNHKPNITTPSTLTSQSVQSTHQNPAIISLQKQLKYDESPASSLKLKLEKSSAIDSHECRRRLEMLPSSSKHQSSSSSSKSHHHHHHREHREHKNRDYRPSTSNTTSSSSSKHRADPFYHHRNANSSAQHHHYVNAMPSPNRFASSSSGSNRYINQSDLCTKIISGNCLPINQKPSISSKEKDLLSSGSFSTSNSSTTSSERSSERLQIQQNQKYHNHTSACCGVENSKLVAERTAIDNSMRCTLRRGRPNTPKTGLNVDYRIRKSSVPNTPECSHLAASRVNHTISSDDYKHISGEDLKKNLTSYIQAAASSKSLMSKSKSNIVVNLSTSSLNTAMVAADIDDPTTSRSKLNANDDASLNESNGSRLLDMAFNEDDLDDSDSNSDSKSLNTNITTNSESVQSLPTKPVTTHARKLSKSLSLGNLLNEDALPETSQVNTTSISDNSYPVTISSDNKCPSNENLLHLQACSLEESLPEVVTQEVKVGEETFKFKIPEVMEEAADNLLENVLRRQSLFKLKDKINGKVSKQISEIERRKLSPYRFSNSPLKAKKAKEHAGGLGKSSLAKRAELPVSKLSEIPEESYVVKGAKKMTNVLKSPTRGFKNIDQNVVASNSPTMVRVAGLANKFFTSKFNKSRNVKRLNATTSVGSPNLENRCPNMSLQLVGGNSPSGKRLLGSGWKLSDESVDL